MQKSEAFETDGKPAEEPDKENKKGRVQDGSKLELLQDSC